MASIATDYRAGTRFGAIERGQLGEQAQRRVPELTALTALSERIAAATKAGDLTQVVVEGLRGLVQADACFLHLLEHDGPSLRLTRADPPDATAPSTGGEPTKLFGLLRARTDEVHAGGDTVAFSSVIAAGEEMLGTVSVARAFGFSDDEQELIRAVASQAAVALARTQLIERLTGETAVRHVLGALEQGNLELARAGGLSVGLDLDGPFLVVVAGRVLADSRSWANFDQQLEQRLSGAAGVLVDRGPNELRGITCLTGRELDEVLSGLRAVATEEGIALGASWGETARGPAVVREAADACKVATHLAVGGGLLTYGDLGAYRFLVRLADDDLPHERQAAAISKLAEYDRQRKSELLSTLEQYLHRRGALAATARDLIVHPNTLRQRLQRIERVSGLVLDDEDLLALELTIKAARLRNSSVS